MACADQRTGSGLNSFTVFVSVYRIVDLSLFVVPVYRFIGSWVSVHRACLVYRSIGLSVYIWCIVSLTRSLSILALFCDVHIS